MSLLAAPACGGGGDDSSPPPSSPPPSAPGETITGRERFGWTQIGSASDAAIIQFAVYVDGVRRVLEGATCAPSGAELDCSAPLPSMTAGRHTLELAAFLPSGDTTIEGPKSAALQVTIAGVVASSDPASTNASAPPIESGPVAASDGSERTADVVGSGLLDPADLALDPAGRLFVVERTGAIHVVDQDGTTTSGDRIDDLSSSRDADAVVLSLALAPDFATSRHVFVLKVIPSGEESRALLVRYRELDGRFGEAAVIVSTTLPEADPTGVMRFGPDGALYVGLGSRDEAGASAEGGRILRLTADGRTPRDNPRASPIFSSGHRDPSGLAWDRQRRLFEVEGGGTRDEVNVVRGGGDYGWPAASAHVRASLATTPAAMLPTGTAPSGVTVVGTGEALIVASAGLQDLLSLPMSPDGDATLGEPTLLLQGRFGAIGPVTAGPDGTIYFLTRNRDSWGPGQDLVVRLSPPSR